MGKNKLFRLLAAVLAGACLLGVVAAVSSDLNNDGKTNVWDLQLAMKGESADPDAVLEAVLGGKDELKANEDGVYDIHEGRHPVVEASGGHEQFVPNDTYLDASDRVMIITGPNTGGKTVTLKTIGLFALMAQAGLQSTVFWYLNFPNGGFCGHDPVGATERIGKLLLRLSAEKAATAARAFKENGAVLAARREKKRAFYPKH